MMAPLDYPGAPYWTVEDAFVLNGRLPSGIYLEGDCLYVEWPEEPEYDPGGLAALASKRFRQMQMEGCLQFVRDPAATLARWWEHVLPGGSLTVIVPDEDQPERAYPSPECERQPERWQFTLFNSKPATSRSLNLVELLADLPDCRIGAFASIRCRPHREKVPFYLLDEGGYLRIDCRKG